MSKLATRRVARRQVLHYNDLVKSNYLGHVVGYIRDPDGNEVGPYVDAAPARGAVIPIRPSRRSGLVCYKRQAFPKSARSKVSSISQPRRGRCAPPLLRRPPGARLRHRGVIDWEGQRPLGASARDFAPAFRSPLCGDGREPPCAVPRSCAPSDRPATIRPS